MIQKIKLLILKQQFEPSFLGLIVNPFYFARKGLVSNIKVLGSLFLSGKILDVGCGSKPYQKFFVNSTEYIGLEIDTPENRNHKKADYFYDGKSFPFENGSFDSILTSQVFEHVFNPDEFLKEVNKVLKTQGVLLLTVPFVWDEHEQPFDYARYSSFGLRHILEKHGFEIMEQRKSVDDIRVIFQLINDYIYKKTVSQNPYLNLLITLVLMAPCNILGEIISKILPKNSDLYLDNIILARKVKNA